MPGRPVPGRQLAAGTRIELPAVATAIPAADERPAASGPAGETRAVHGADPADDDADMVVLEEDLEAAPAAVVQVRPGDYRSLFARLRRGDRTLRPGA